MLLAEEERLAALETWLLLGYVSIMEPYTDKADAYSSDPSDISII
jgi:hypothetical protein